MKITSQFLREKFLQFFSERGHAVIPSASLIPENDPSVLFTTAGMHPLIPYLMGQKHPKGNRLCDVQKCVRTGDIEEVGDDSHLTFFEMLGNWSLGDYFNHQSIAWSYEFLTSKQYLGLDPDRISVTVFAGDEDAPRDDDSAAVWQQCGIPKERIFYLPKKNNWWIAGTTGPCGPDTEIFWDTGKPACGENCDPSCDCGKYLEIWNNVFMQYNKQADGSYLPLAQKNVDTGMGLERTVCVLNGYKSVYDIDLFAAALEKIQQLSGKKYDDNVKSMRIIADHVRTATFLLGDPVGVVPSNVDQGYVLRRLIRRAVRMANSLGMAKGSIAEIAKVYVQVYKDAYPELTQNADKIVSELNKEEEKFSKTLVAGEKEFFKVISHIPGKTVPGGTAFKLYDTFGFPVEMTVELAAENGYTVDVEGFRQKFAEHQARSHAGSEQRFKGGMAEGGGIETVYLHTATHLLQAALRRVLGDEVKQKGSNITPERLRFDFSFGRPMTKEEIEKTEALVNQAIEQNLPITCEEMPVEDARKTGAIGLFGDRYGEVVKVYSMGDFSKEICGGPHAASTGELGKFVITKEQSSSAGVRRIKAELHRE
ncbi:MAG TPA: alanine--tRNA ligase [Candidatus Fimimonas merdipullorum]|uniref:Alanine--tRNA ligase n=1 Tax=Candidatus Fimimonas merdipullorum TaxID=2840822 RepID=A0A9D1MWH8_9BACT|nr:alanine--tRNA ligase [Candidatus Fimimonas merdipullorum]